MKLRVVTHLSFTEGIQLIVKSVEDEAPYGCLTDKPPWHMITLMLKCVTPVGILIGVEGDGSFRYIY